MPAIEHGARQLRAGAGALVYTSGSTTTPRIVVLSHNGLKFNARATAERLGIEKADELLLPLPMHHAYGFSVLEMARRNGARLHLETVPSARRILRRLPGPRIATLDGFPSFYRQLLKLVYQQPALASLLRDIGTIGCGGDLLPRGIAEEFAVQVGAPLCDGYGLTEAGPNVAISTPGCHRLGTVGPPLSGVEVRLADDAELLVRSPSVMMGYLDDETAMDNGRWLATGDLAELDSHGYLRVIGRKKHVITVHGQCNSPTRIEEAVLDVGEVQEAIAIGLPGRKARGDEIILFVRPAGRTSADHIGDRVLASCRAHLPPHLRPDSIVVLDSFPRGATGKPDRDALRRRAATLS